MTLLRRTAQFIEDLKTLRVISEKDEILVENGGKRTYEEQNSEEDCITITIKWKANVICNKWERWSWNNTRALVSNCLSEEFREEGYKIDYFSDYHMKIILMREK